MKNNFTLVFNFLFFSLSLFVIPPSQCQEIKKASVLKKQSSQLILMGSAFELVAYHHDEEKAIHAIKEAIREIQRIEEKISSWKQNSLTAQINRNAGITSVSVDQEYLNLVRRCIKVSQLTQGAFDITFAGLNPIWFFDRKMDKMPEDATIKKSIKNVGYQNIIINDSLKTIGLYGKGMKIGFGAIGKGYAANKAKQIMQNIGIKNGLINAGGDLLTWGQKEGFKDWLVGIADPQKKRKYCAWLVANNYAVVTSGNYEKFQIINGKRYAHIINPKTGYPVTGIKSVTILCPDAELADALATAVFVMGKENGLQLLNQLNGIEGLIITDKNEMISSQNLSLKYYIDD